MNGQWNRPYFTVPLLNSKVGLNWNLPALFKPRGMINMLLRCWPRFSICTVSYGSWFFFAVFIHTGMVVYAWTK